MSEEREFRKKILWICLIIAISTGVLMITFLSFYKTGDTPYYGSSVIFSIGCGVLIAGASLSAGGFLGFIFGIPKITQSSASTLKYNDNLVQISDWLTKIVVGVGLTQLYNIPNKIKSLGEAFQVNFGNDTFGRNAAIAIICYFFLLGFFMLYFWTKTDYSIIMKDLDDEINRQLEEKLKIQTFEKEIIIKEKQDVEHKLETVQKDSQLKEQDINAVIQTFSSSADSVKQKMDFIKTSPDIADDPQNGKWGKPNANGRKISATVRETSFDKEWFNINIEVTTTDENKPLNGEVVFYLHPSFPEPIRKVQADGKSAQLQLVAWGSFTVGVECDNGATKLELDLEMVPGAPQLFKDR